MARYEPPVALEVVAVGIEKLDRNLHAGGSGGAVDESDTVMMSFQRYGLHRSYNPAFALSVLRHMFPGAHVNDA
jgi:hypothetical protein